MAWASRLRATWTHLKHSPQPRRRATTLPDTRTIALVKLLDEEDAATVHAVAEALLAVGLQAIAPLRVAAESDNARLRARARLLLDKLLLHEAESELAAMVAGNTPDLERALVLLARTEHPALSLEEVAAALDDLATTAQAAMEGAYSPANRVERFVHALFEIERLRGNTSDYYDPRNSMIDAVLERRTGIPISLAAVVMLVGRRCGLTMQGIGMPRHFLVRITCDGTSFIIDAFGSGQVLTPEACRALLTGLAPEFRDEFLAPVSDRAMLRRVLENLLATHARNEDLLRVERFSKLVMAAQTEVA